GEQVLGCCPFGAQARDTINYFHPFLARLLEDHVTAQFKDLRQPGPIAVAYEGLTRREIALLDAPMAQVDSPCRSLTVTNRRERKDQLDIGPQPWLVLFDLSLTVPRYTNGRACDLNGLQEIIHVSRLSFFTHSCTRSFFVSSLKERNYTYSMYLSTVKVGYKRLEEITKLATS